MKKLREKRNKIVFNWDNPKSGCWEYGGKIWESAHWPHPWFGWAGAWEQADLQTHLGVCEIPGAAVPKGRQCWPQSLRRLLSALWVR